MDERASKQSEESQKRKATKKKKKGVTKFMISSHKRANYDLKQLKE